MTRYRNTVLLPRERRGEPAAGETCDHGRALAGEGCPACGAESGEGVDRARVTPYVRTCSMPACPAPPAGRHTLLCEAHHERYRDWYSDVARDCGIGRGRGEVI